MGEKQDTTTATRTETETTGSQIEEPTSNERGSPQGAVETSAREFTAAAEDGVPDPFDPERLRVSQNPTAGLGVKKVHTAIPVRKPSKEWFFKLDPRPGYLVETYVIELKEDREVYLVEPSLWDSLAGESTFGPRVLTVGMNTLGTLFVWPIRLPGHDGRQSDWHASALEAANLAKKNWVRVQANMSLGAYDTYVATGNFHEPDWPDLSMRDILRIAFKSYFIDNLDHPVLKRLRGES